MNKINLKITPFWQESKISKANINILADISCQKDSVLFSIYKQVTNKKFVDLEGSFLIKDKIGNIDCISKTSSQMHVETESYLPERATEGNVEISYTVVVNPVKKNPAFDFGYEDNGVTGSGMTFLPLFECDYCDFSIEWDLSKVPDDFTGVCSFGEGNCSVQGNPSIIQECFFLCWEN